MNVFKCFSSLFDKTFQHLLHSLQRSPAGKTIVWVVVSQLPCRLMKIVVTLEVKIEEPVKELLEDYASFIESTPDHVVNVVLKKNLWRDQDYRKWREERRNQTPER